MAAHFHWCFQAANTGMTEPVEITVFGYATESDALAAVEELLVRDKYRLLRVYECTSCEYQKELSGVLRQSFGS